MNGTGIFVAIVLMAVLFGVAVNAEGVANVNYSELETALKQRDELMSIVTESNGQRDMVVAQRDEAQKQVAAIETEKADLQVKLDNAVNAGVASAAEIDGLKAELAIKESSIIDLSAKVTSAELQVKALEDKNSELTAKVDMLQNVIAGLESGPISTTGTTNTNNRLESVIVLVIGMGILSSGVFFARRKDAKTA